MRRSRGRLGPGLAAAALLIGCASDPPPPPGLSPDDARRVGEALDYLARTDDELGIDVLLALEAYAARSGDARALEVVEARRGDLRPADVERYGALLSIPKPAFAPSSLDGVAAPVDAPDPSATLPDGRVQSCLDEIVACEASAACLDYAALESWGYVLTHQAVWLLFDAWLGCGRASDAEALRRGYAARIVAEARVDDAPSDLSFERLAMLGQLGFAREIEPAWLDALREAQQPQGCFPVNEEVRCHPHPTAFALWALGHTVE